jgi:hypothetical protein
MADGGYCPICGLAVAQQLPREARPPRAARVPENVVFQPSRTGGLGHHVSVFTSRAGHKWASCDCPGGLRHIDCWAIKKVLREAS